MTEGVARFTRNVCPSLGRRLGSLRVRVRGLRLIPANGFDVLSPPRGTMSGEVGDAAPPVSDVVLVGDASVCDPLREDVVDLTGQAHRNAMSDQPSGACSPTR